MKPHLHCKGSAKRYGGVPDDYVDIHSFMDSTKSALADIRHRAILHNSFGIFLAEKVFGITRTNSEGKVYAVRDVAEDHVIEDLGRIPTIEQWVKNMNIEPWMGGLQRKDARKNIKKRDMQKEETNV